MWLIETVALTFVSAWPVNFNLPLESFAGALDGLLNIIDFAASSQLPVSPRLIFSSTVGIFQGTSFSGKKWLHTHTMAALQSRGLAREVPQSDASVAHGLGYTESKWVAEQLIDCASNASGFQALVVRVGQMCGGRGGSWNTKEWVPALVRTSVALGAVPLLEGVRVSAVRFDLNSLRRTHRRRRTGSHLTSQQRRLSNRATHHTTSFISSTHAPFRSSL